VYSTFCEFCGEICEFCGEILYVLQNQWEILYGKSTRNNLQKHDLEPWL